jgi:malonate-semialdehyde dehydrogenase (acetylating)/methylmalonate-semialdehyde dehydrogenase
MVQRLQNYVNGHWQSPSSAEALKVLNPASVDILAEVPLSTRGEVDAAAQAAAKAFPEWRRTPVGDRIQPLFKLKSLLEQHLDDLARTITNECGKTYAESVGELRRAIENVEVACGVPSLMQGYANEDIAQGIDEQMIRQPLGVVAAITPFNFPAMIPFWFLPYALATGNCFILKPSERVPLTSNKVFRLAEAAGFPAGVVQLVNGGKETVNAILDHPLIRAVSFVSSTATARAIYSRAAANGKRAQCQGGARNPVVILPDADLDMTAKILADSAFGCAGQRCLAASVAVTIAGEDKGIIERIVESARSRRVGYGLDPKVEMGPVISAESRARIESLVAKGEQQGASLLVDGRGRKVKDYEAGFFVFPTILDNVAPGGEIDRTEIFGPVLSLMSVRSLHEAIQIVNARSYGNMACIFTSNGASARRFRNEVNSGNLGINVGVAAPIAYFPFSGWGDSFFGDLHAQARHGVEFYTQTKVIIERWPRAWSRKF